MHRQLMQTTTTLQNQLLQRKDFSFTSTVMDALKSMREIQSHLVSLKNK